MSLTTLKVKRLSLASESKHIRRLEKAKARAANRARKANKDGLAELSEAERHSLYLHRINVVRKAARVAHLADGFLRGLPYAAMENFAYTSPDWDKVEDNAVRFSSDDERTVKQRFAEWKDQAFAYMDANDFSNILGIENWTAKHIKKANTGFFAKLANMFG
jgi:hypothetical protein